MADLLKFIKKSKKTDNNRNTERSKSGSRRMTAEQSRQNKQGKLKFMFGFFIVLFVALAIRLVFIVQKHGTEYQKAVLQNQGYDSTILPFRRGDILDANGTILATSEKVYNIIIDASVMLTYEDHRYFEPTIRAIEETLPMLDAQAIKHHMQSLLYRSIHNN